MPHYHQIACATLLEVLEGLLNKAVHFRDKLKEVIAADRKGWLICAAVLFITIIRSGITYSFGVFVVAFNTKDDHPSLAKETWIGTLSFCISLSCAPVSVAFIRCLGYRGYRIAGLLGTAILSLSCLATSFILSLHSIDWMFLTHSLVYGVGSSLIYMASSLVIGEYFDKHHKYHVLATSILLCGYPVGSLIFNPINALLLKYFSPQVAFRIAGILILFTGIGCCWTFMPKTTGGMQRLEDEEGEQDDKGESKGDEKKANVDPATSKPSNRYYCTFQSIRERPEILLWYIGSCLCYIGFYMPFLNLPFYMEKADLGIDTALSSLALTLLSLTECVTYVVASFLGDYLKGRIIYCNVVSAGALAILCFIWPLIDVNFSMILLLSIIMGGFLGLTIVYSYAASGEVTQLPIDVAWSFTNLWSGIGILVGPLFYGVVFDIRKNFDDVFYVVGALYVVNTMIFGAIPLLQKYRSKREANLLYGQPDGGYGAEEQHKQTFRITKRSISKSSLANGDLQDGDATVGVASVGDYGATGVSNHHNHHQQLVECPPSEYQQHQSVTEADQAHVPFPVSTSVG